jgi:hypothetical protein
MPIIDNISTSQECVRVIMMSLSTPPTATEPSQKPKDHKFTIHRDFICYYSPFFSAAFNGSFEEGQTQKMKLDDVDPQLFAILVNWVYIQEVSDRR